jgi:hypothetical protein
MPAPSMRTSTVPAATWRIAIQGAATRPVRRPHQHRHPRANQIRLYFSSFAYVMLCALRRLGLADTELERAQCGTIRLRLLKIGAQVRISVRRVWVSFSDSFPNAAVFRQALARIRGPALAPGSP